MAKLFQKRFVTFDNYVLRVFQEKFYWQNYPKSMALVLKAILTGNNKFDITNKRGKNMTFHGSVYGKD